MQPKVAVITTPNIEHNALFLLAVAGGIAALDVQSGKMKEELKSITASLADLKDKLYGRFGKNINLEE